MVIKLEEYKRENKFVMVDPRIMKDNKVTPRDKAIYLSLCGYMNRETRSCYPSHKKISYDTDLSISTVKRGLKSLENREYIKIEKRLDKTSGRTLSNLYFVL